MSGPRLSWGDWLGMAVLVAAVLLAGAQVERGACAVEDRPPCELGGDGECGCEPVNPPCNRPCSGCCPGGCKAAPPSPVACGDGCR